MSNEPILLFLHGIGSGDKDDVWKVSLTKALEGLGYPNLDTVRVIAPKYANALKGWDDKVPLPDETIKQPSRQAATTNRRNFERRMGAIEVRLGRHNRGINQHAIDVALNVGFGFAVKVPQFGQAQNYLQKPEIRAQVLKKILKELPESGRLVIIGHSLGSVIAADLVRRLPIGLEVVGMVTIGSPLAHGCFNVDKLRASLKDPPTNLAWWVNFWNTSDLVSAHRGVSSVFPWMVDFRIDSKRIVGPDAHAAIEYLAEESVAAAIGFALFGSRSKELATINKGLDIQLDATELIGLLALRYAHHIKATLDGDIQDRYTGALRSVQATIVDEIRSRNDRESRAMPFEVARLAFDLSDPKAPLPEAHPVPHLSKDEAVALLTMLASENVIRPYEIEISKDKREAAMKDLTAEMGLGSQYGADVFAATKRAQESLRTNSDVNWVKWGVVGAGAAALVVATGGLALAAAPGVAGAALITSALASFGPGGMIGGLLTAGTLVGAGGGGIAFGLASPGTSAEIVEAVVSRRLAAAILRQRQHLDPDPETWRILVETEMQIRREYERVDEFSDESAPSLKELKRKINAIERALAYLIKNGLEPGNPTGGADEAD